MAEAVYCSLTPMGRVRLSGATEMAVIVGAFTVTEVDPETELRVAVIVALPAATPVTNPEALTVASAMVDEFQLTCAVMSRLLPSL